MALNSIIGWILFYLDRDLSSMKLMLKPNLANIRSEKSWVSHFFFAELVNYLLLLTCQTTLSKIYYKMAHMKLLLQYNRNRISESNGKLVTEFVLTTQSSEKVWTQFFFLFKNRQKKFLKLANKHFIYFTLL